MKVFVNGVLYDPNDVPIVAILSKADKKNIAAMPEGYTRYMCAPEGTTETEMNGIFAILRNILPKEKDLIEEEK